MKKSENGGKTREKINKIVYVGLFSVFALALSYVERLIPLDLGVPGIKPGLANLATLVVLYTIGTGAAFSVAAVRICLAALLFGSPMSLLYSAAGGICSLSAMILLKKICRCGPLGSSSAAGAVHNAAQLCVAAAITKTAKIFSLLPVMLAVGAATGMLLGIIAATVIPRLSKIKDLPSKEDKNRLIH